ncbi:MAG: glutamate-5-semialdehyde dehydrogenase [Ruminococcaceae bacterium]|nr:glutamate-5-semialdehyde dehydrogenase [Oscillospiraceae bacterium]
MEIRDELVVMARTAGEASRFLNRAGTDQKNKALEHIAEALTQNTDYILGENAKDICAARDNGIKESMIDRLTLTRKSIEAIAASVRKVVALPDPTGISEGFTRPNGLVITKTSVPLGVIGIIYESRPNVTVDAASLCLKSSNAVILRGGKEAIYSNIALVKVINEALASCGFPKGCVNLIESTSRDYTNALMKLHGYVDVIIPRGSAGLIKAVCENSTVPVIETGAGNCHIYVDESADFDMACDIIINAKVQRPSVCNAAENLLVHSAVAKDFLPVITEKLIANGVEVRASGECAQYLNGFDVKEASDEDFYTEYNDYIISVKTVESIDEAISHINKHNTGHSEAIITKSLENSTKFSSEVDAAAVYTNASTRFTDGEEFGFGAEIGISTQKLHARGPMALKELTTVKYIISGNGQIR